MTVTSAVHLYSLQSAHMVPFLCSGACNCCEGMQVMLVQERPVTKEVVTYVQERRPVAKQVLLL